MNKRILMSGLMIAAVAAVVVGATSAFFSDTETSTGNIFTAGALDLRVDSQCHYFQDGRDVGCGNFGNWRETDLQDGIHKFFSFDDIKPGDHGEDTISLHVYNNDAWGRFVIASVSDQDVTCTEPESESADPECNPAGVPGEGELAENMVFSAFLDQGAIPGFQNVDAQGNPVDANVELPDIQKPDPTEGDNIQQCLGVIEQEIVNCAEPTVITEGNVDVPGETHDIWPALAAAYTLYGCTDVDGNTGYGLCQGLAQDGRMVGSTTYYFGLNWSLPEAVGNEVQTDELMADLTFQVVQHRNNPGHSF